MAASRAVTATPGRLPSPPATDERPDDGRVGRARCRSLGPGWIDTVRLRQLATASPTCRSASVERRLRRSRPRPDRPGGRPSRSSSPAVPFQESATVDRPWPSTRSSASRTGTKARRTPSDAFTPGTAAERRHDGRRDRRCARRTGRRSWRARRGSRRRRSRRARTCRHRSSVADSESSRIASDREAGDEQHGATPITTTIGRPGRRGGGAVPPRSTAAGGAVVLPMVPRLPRLRRSTQM